VCGKKWDEDERRVCDLLLFDFEKSGIRLDKQGRNECVGITNNILARGQTFIQNSNRQSVVRIPTSEFMGISGRVLKDHESRGSVSVEGNSGLAWLVLRQCRNEETRKKVYDGMHAGSDAQVDVLERMLEDRHRVARIVGFDSYGHLWLRDKMAQSPGTLMNALITIENVMSFLEKSMQKAKKGAEVELRELQGLKQAYTRQSGEVHAWDRYFYAQLMPPVVNVTETTPLTVGQTMEALSWVFTKMYGMNTLADID